MKRTAIMIPIPSLTHSALASSSNVVTALSALISLLCVTRYPIAQIEVTKLHVSFVLHMNFHVNLLRTMLLFDASPEIMSATTSLTVTMVLMRNYLNVKRREGKTRRIQCLLQLYPFQETTQRE